MACPNLSEPVRICPSLSKPIQAYPSLSKPIQACPSLSEPVRACPNLSEQSDFGNTLLWYNDRLLENPEQLKRYILYRSPRISYFQIGPVNVKVVLHAHA